MEKLKEIISKNCMDNIREGYDKWIEEKGGESFVELR